MKRGAPGYPWFRARFDGRARSPIAALQTQRVDYRAVLAAINALGANQRDLTTRVSEVEGGLKAVETRLGTLEITSQDTNSRVRSLEHNVAEMKDLLGRALDR